jgi:hypothetical protein
MAETLIVMAMAGTLIVATMAKTSPLKTRQSYLILLKILFGAAAFGIRMLLKMLLNEVKCMNQSARLTGQLNQKIEI